MVLRPVRVAVLVAAAWACGVAACSGGEKPRQAPAVALRPPGPAPAPGAAAPDTGAAPGASVDMPRSYLFRPETLTVRPGTRVTWTNHDVFTHGVKLGDVQLTARPGGQVSYVFTRPGTFPYVCPFHPQMMKGVIRVAAGR